MLSEGYLCGISYWSEEEDVPSMFYEEAGAVDNCNKELKSVCGRNCTPGARSKDTAKRTCHRDTLQQRNQPSLFERRSANVEISGEANSNRETYLVPPSCKSICTNYNDLHIAGDQVMPMNSEMTDFNSDSSFEFCDGPFLESFQIPPTVESAMAQLTDHPSKQKRGNSSLWRVGSGRDRSIMHQQQPLSNAVLNEYLEQKVIELYKQYIMDNMGNNASPNQIMASELIMNNVDQISMLISREKNMGTSRAKDMVIECLLRLASGKISNVSNEISTPELQMSSDEISTPNLQISSDALEEIISPEPLILSDASEEISTPELQISPNTVFKKKD